MSIMDALMSIGANLNPTVQMKKKIMEGGGGDSNAIQPPPAPAPGPTNVPPQPAPNTVDNSTTGAIAATTMPTQGLPDAYKTPPDLSQLYVDMLNQTYRREQINSGMTLIAAGLTPTPSIREKLIGESSPKNAGGDSGMSVTMQSLINMQKEQQALAAKNAIRSQLPAIAKAHGLSLEDVSAMYEGGQLEEFLKQADSPANEVTERADGSKALIDKRTGKTISEISPPKARGQEYIDVGGGKKVLVYSDTKQPVNPDEALPSTTQAPPNIDFQEDPVTHAKLAFDKNTGKRVPEMDIAGPGPKITYKEDPINHTQLAFDEGGNRVPGKDVAGVGPKTLYLDGQNGAKLATDEAGNRVPEKDIPPVQQIEVQKDANGQFQAIDKISGKPIGLPFGSAENKPTDDMKEYAASKAAADSRGATIDPFDVWLAKKEQIRGPKDISGNKLEEQLGVKRAASINQSYEEAYGARDTIDYINTARQQLNKGIIAGSDLSTSELKGRKLWADIFGVPDDKTTTTEVFRASLKEVVLGKIKALGSGTAISDADRRFIEAATGSDTSLTPQAMKQIFDILDKGARNKIDRYNRDVTDLLGTYDDPEARKSVARSVPLITDVKESVPVGDLGKESKDSVTERAKNLDYYMKKHGGAKRSLDDVMTEHGG